MILAVLFDLDDTLYPQSQWLAGAWAAVAARAAADGAPRTRLRDALDDVAAEGSDRGRIIDRALARVGCPGLRVAPLVDAFRAYAPESMTCYPGVSEALARLHHRAQLGLVTDGDARVQRAKIRALGLDDAFDEVVYSDELGRAHRKPDPAPFLAALEHLGATPTTTVVVGDRPSKDVAGARAAGMRAIRVCTGEYANQPDVDGTWHRASDAAAACAWLESRVGATVVRA